MDIDQILQDLGNDILNESTQTLIKEAFVKAVDKKAETIVEERVEIALEAQDAEYTVELEKLMESVDVDHTEKLSKIVEVLKEKFKVEKEQALNEMDEDHSKKLQKILEHYEEKLPQEAEKLAESMINVVDAYLEDQLEKAIPTDLIKEAAKNRKSRELIEKVKDLTVVDEAYTNHKLHDTLTSTAKEIAQLKKEKELAQEAVRKIQVENYLTEKTSSMPKEKANYISNLLKGKTFKHVSENFNYVEQMFERRDKAERKLISENTPTQTRNVDRSETVLNEQNERSDDKFETSGDPDMDLYLKSFKRS